MRHQATPGKDASTYHNSQLDAIALANAGLLVDYIQQGDGGAFFAAAAIPSGMNPAPFHTLRGVTVVR